MSNCTTEVKRGSTFTQLLECLDENDAAVNISGWTITSELRSAPEDDAALLTFAITETDPPNGKFTITATAAQTADLPARRKLYYDVKLEPAVGEVIYSENVFIMTSKHVTA